MMDFRVKASTLISYMKAVDAWKNAEQRIHYAPDGLHIRGVDPANVMMVMATLPASTLLDYKYTSPPQTPAPSGEYVDEYVYATDVKRLVKLLTKAHYTEDVRVTIDEVPASATIVNGKVEQTSGRQTLIIDGTEAKITQRMLDERSVRKDPKIYIGNHGEATVEVSAQWLYRAIRDIGEFSTHAEFTIDQRGLTVGTESDQNDTISYTRPITGLRAHACANGQICRSLYSIDYLLSATRLIGQPTMRLRMGTDYPIHISPVFEQMQIEYLLAPRIESQ